METYDAVEKQVSCTARRKFLINIVGNEYC